MPEHRRSPGIVLLVRRDPRATRFIGVLLAIHWAWSGIAYHLAFFRTINPAATLFGTVFVLQAGLFLWWTMRAPPSAFQLKADLWSHLGVSLMVYALLYPALGVICMPTSRSPLRARSCSRASSSPVRRAPCAAEGDGGA